MERPLFARVRGWFVVSESDAIVAAAPPVPVREVFRRFWPYARQYRRWLVVSLAFIVAGPGVETATIWLFKVVVAEGLVPEDPGPLPWIAAIYVGLALLGGAIAFGDDLLTSWIGGRFILGLRRSVFAQ